jgi:hypothetical protein
VASSRPLASSLGAPEDEARRSRRRSSARITRRTSIRSEGSCTASCQVCSRTAWPPRARSESVAPLVRIDAGAHGERDCRCADEHRLGLRSCISSPRAVMMVGWSSLTDALCGRAGPAWARPPSSVPAADRGAGAGVLRAVPARGQGVAGAAFWDGSRCVQLKCGCYLYLDNERPRRWATVDECRPRHAPGATTGRRAARGRDVVPAGWRAASGGMGAATASGQ